jgi:glycosyltransferase involved in cell wall biosynthesis
MARKAGSNAVMAVPGVANPPKLRMLVVTECEHFAIDGQVVAPRHFTREIDLWAQMFAQIELATRFPPWPMPRDADGYESKKIEFVVANGAFSPGFVDKVLSLARSTVAAFRIVKGTLRADVVHIRCPARNALIALLVQRLLPRPLYVKWAGEWALPGRMSLSSRLQRQLLFKLRRPLVVTVYEKRPHDPDWVHEVVTSSLTRTEVEKALSTSPQKEKAARSLLWVGRMSSNKNVVPLLNGLQRLFHEDPRVNLHLAGDGPELGRIEEEVRRLGLDGRVILHGSLRWDELCELYNRARLLVLPSGTEGFPKVVHEAALFGVPSVVFAVAALPRIVANRGIAVEPAGDFAAYANAVRQLLDDSTLLAEFSECARAWAGNICIEKVVERYRALCSDTWGFDLPQLV